MSNSVKQVVERDGSKFVLANPVNHVNTDGSLHKYEYSFNRVYPSDVPDDFNAPTGATLDKLDGNTLMYQYRDKPRVLITQNGPYVEEGCKKGDAQNQAYYILSILDSNGFVGGFKKQ